MNEKPVKVLLIEDELEDLRLIEEALAELDEVRFSRAWLQACELLHAEDIAEALELLGAEPADVVLLDLSLPDGSGSQAFLSIQEQAPEVPVIILAADHEEEQALSLIRQGAQDYVLKSEVDCIPLARSVRCAVERQRVRSALRSLAFVDDLTGLFADGGFHQLAERYHQMARDLNRDFWIEILELEGLERICEIHGSQERDMTVILAAETLRAIYPETAIIGRVGKNRFAVAALAIEREVPGRAKESAERIEATNGRRSAPPWLTVSVGRAQAAGDTPLDLILETAENSLCENRRSGAAV